MIPWFVGSRAAGCNCGGPCWPGKGGADISDMKQKKINLSSNPIMKLAKKICFCDFTGHINIVNK